MGQQIAVKVAREPEWPIIRDSLAKAGEQAVVRMIDGLPAFPDEVPEPGWGELRLGMNGGMVSLRRSAGEILCVVWGNADEALLKSWRACAAAVAEAAG
jgi:hypothetical protein